MIIVSRPSMMVAPHPLLFRQDDELTMRSFNGVKLLTVSWMVCLSKVAIHQRPMRIVDNHCKHEQRRL